MEKLTPKLKSYKEEFDFIHKKIGELEWERATINYGRIAIPRSVVDRIETELMNYRENMAILIEKIECEARNNKTRTSGTRNKLDK